MPELGRALTDAEVALLGVTLPRDVTAVWGRGHDGRPILRAVRAATITALVGEPGKGFVAGGPSATLCYECSAVLYDTTKAGLGTLQQRHLAAEHGISVGMLP